MVVLVERARPGSQVGQEQGGPGNLLVHEHGRPNRHKMPQAVSVDAAQPRRKVKELHAHSHHDPWDHGNGHDGPQALGFLVASDAEPGPQDVLRDADDNIGSHVVCVIPPHALEVRHVEQVQHQTHRSPRPERASPLGRRAVEAEDANGRVVQAVEDVGPRGEVVQLLGGLEIARVEEGAEEPAGHAHVRQDDVERPQGVRGGNAGANLAQAVVVGPEVSEGEEDAEGLLHAEEAAERPFAVELDDGFRGGDALVRDDVLARVVAFGGAVPEQDAVEQS